MHPRLSLYSAAFILLSGVLIRTNALDDVFDGRSKWSEQGVVSTNSNAAAAVTENIMKREKDKKRLAPTNAMVSGENTEPQPGTSITVLSPNGGEYFAAGDTMRIQWTVDPDSVNDVMIWLLLDGGLEKVLITCNFSVRPEDSTWGDYLWVIPPDAKKDTVSLLTDKAAIRLHQYRDTHFEDYSDDYFTIGEGVTVREKPRTNVLSPLTAGEFSLHRTRNTVVVSGLPASHSSTLQLVDLFGRVLATVPANGSKALVESLTPGGAGMVFLHVRYDNSDISKRCTLHAAIPQALP